MASTAEELSSQAEQLQATMEFFRIDENTQKGLMISKAHKKHKFRINHITSGREGKQTGITPAEEK
jgi:hypothetical protein